MEPRICVFKVAVVSADNLWSADASREGSKAAVRVHFPGEDAASLYQSEAVLPSTTTDVSPPRVSVSLNASSDYVRASDWLLWHQLVTDPLAISLVWISSSFRTATTIGTVLVDLTELLFSKDLFWEKVCTLEAVVSAEEQHVLSKQLMKDALQKATTKGKKAHAIDVVPPCISKGASIKVQITLDIPILSDSEREEGILLEFSNFHVQGVPPQYAETSINAFIIGYSLAFEIPGFSGPWWSSFSTAKLGMKDSLSVARINDGVVAVAPPKPNNLPLEQKVEGAALSEGCTRDATTTGTLSSAWKNDLFPIISWNTSVRRFLPSVAARELKESIWKKQTWHGEIARYVNVKQPSESVPPFEMDHLSTVLNLSTLMEEGVFEKSICSSLELFTTKQALLNEHNILSNGKKSKTGAIASPWQVCSSQFVMCVKLNRPLQPAWAPPAKPQLTLADILSVRPKLPTFDEKLEMAVSEFKSLVCVGAESIFSLQEKLVSNCEIELTNVPCVWDNRIATGHMVLEHQSCRFAIAIF